MTELYNIIIPSIFSKLKGDLIPRDKMIEAMRAHKGEGYSFIFDMEKREDYKGYQGAAAPCAGWFVIDIDSADLEQARSDALKVWEIMGLNESFARVFFSGKKGFHIYIRQEYFTNARTIQDYKKVISDLKKTIPTLDTSIYHANGKFRLPNSLHPKSNLYKIEVSLPHLLAFSIGAILDLARSPQPITLDQYDVSSFSNKEDSSHMIPVIEMALETLKTFYDDKTLPIISGIELSGVTSMMAPIATFGTENVIMDDLSNTYAYSEKPCITSIWKLKDLPEGSRHEYARVLVDDLAKSGLPLEAAKDKLLIWLKQNDMPESRIRDYLNRQVVRRFDGTDKYDYGCNNTEKDRHCNPFCPIYKKPTEITKTLEPKKLEEHRIAIFDQAIKDGFHSIKTIKGKVVKTPDIERLKEYFDASSPYVSLMESNITSVWNGTHYKDVPNTQIKMFAHEMFRPAPSISTSNEFMARIHHTNPRSMDWFEQTTRNKINLANGVFCTETGAFIPGHSPARGFKYCLPYAYSPEATAPMFAKMLDKITSGDKARAQVILEFIGYSLSGSKCFADKIMVMTGEGSNGKSRFLNVVRGILGSDSVTGLRSTDFEKDAKVKKLETSLLAIVEEMPSFAEKAFWENIKDLASGGELTVDIKFKDAISFENRCKLVFTCNKLPNGTDPSHGFFRRLLIVPFEHEFNPTDPDFIYDIDQQIIASELPGVFNMIWEAFKGLKANKFRFSESAAVNRQVEAYKMDSDSVAQWFSETSFMEESDKESKLFTSCLKMHQDYAAWCKERDLRIVGFSEFGRRLLRVYPILKGREARRVVGTKRLSGYWGIALSDAGSGGF